MIALHLLTLILVSVLALLPLGQVSPHLTDDSPDLPKLKLGVLILNLINKGFKPTTDTYHKSLAYRIPNLPAVSHVGHQRLLWSLWRLGSSVLRQSLLPDLLGVEAGIAVLLLHEGVGLDIVLLLLCHEIGL